MSTSHVTLEREGALATIWLDRPAKLNAITPAMSLELRDAVNELDGAPELRVGILRGRGERAFCVGTDLREIGAYQTPWALRNRLDYTEVVRAARKPLLALLHGYVLGGGFELAVCCDYRIASADAVLGMPEVRHGWVGAGAATQLLPRQIGYGRALRIFLTRERLAALKAAELGVVEEVYPTLVAAEGAARELALTIAANPPGAVEAAKAALRMSLRAGVDEGVRYEEELQAICFARPEARAGIEAFRDRAREERGPSQAIL